MCQHRDSLDIPLEAQRCRQHGRIAIVLREVQAHGDPTLGRPVVPLVYTRVARLSGDMAARSASKSARWTCQP